MSATSNNYDELHAQLLRDVQFLPDKPEESAESTLRALWFAATGAPKSVIAAMTMDLPALTESQLNSLKQLVERRVKGEPLSHITGRQHFLGMEMLAGPQALVPRKETELLAQSAIDFAREALTQGEKPVALDVCTGSGNVAAAVAFHVPEARVYAADLSEDAVQLAKRNAEHLNLTSRIEFCVSDLLTAYDQPEFIGRFDVLSCNPPYINSGKVGQMPKEISDYEPRLAFDGGSLGISILMRLINEAPRFLRTDGWLTFEVGLGQGKPLVKRLQGLQDYRQVRTTLDHQGNIRVVSAQR